MSTIKKRTNSRPLNISSNKYSLGSWMKSTSTGALANSLSTKGFAGAVSAGLGGLSGILQGTLNNTQIKNTSGIQNEIDLINNQDFTSTDNSSLLSAYNNAKFTEDKEFSGEDYQLSNRAKFGNTANATISGLTAGASIGGPIGALIGGGIGLLGGIGGVIAGNNKAKKEAERLQKANDLANAQARRAFNNEIDYLRDMNYYDMARNIVALGGPLSETHGSTFKPGDLRIINNGGTHEENPYDGVLQGFDEKGNPNLVEEGEVIYNDYVFSNRLSPSKKLLNDLKLKGKYANKTYAKIAEDLTKESQENPNDSTARRTMENLLMKLQTAQEVQKQRSATNKAFSNQFGRGGIMEEPLPRIDSKIKMPDNIVVALNAPGILGLPRLPKVKASSDIDNLLRFMPAIGSGIGALQSVLTPVDYSSADNIMSELNSYRPRTVRARNASDYMAYKPIDLNTISNSIINNSAATRRNIIATPNAGAVQSALLAEGMNTGNSIGTAMLQGKQYNDSLRNQVNEYNSKINQFNIGNAVQTDQYNSSLLDNYNKARLSTISNIESLKTALKNQRDAEISSNITNMLENLGGIGKENRDTQLALLNSIYNLDGTLKQGVNDDILKAYFTSKGTR